MHLRAPMLFLLTALLSATLFAPSVEAVNYRLGRFFGGDFTLTDQNGQPFSLHDAHGKVVLIHFGFASCADTCPTTLAKVAAAMRELGPLAERVQPLFISIDAKRDTPEVLRQYVSHFHPTYLGLTGTQEEVEAVAQQYRTPVYVHKPDDNGFYVVDHGSTLFLVDTAGMLANMVFFETSPARIAAYVKDLLDQ